MYYDFENVTDTPKEDIPVEEIDKALKNVMEYKLRHQAAKEAATAIHKDLMRHEEKLMDLMRRSGKSRWEVDGVGGFSYYEELKHRVPQSIEENIAFQRFLKSEYVSTLLGQNSDDIFYSYVKVQSQSVNKLCMDLKKLAAEQGEDLQIPGILPPKAEPKLRALPKKK